MATLYGGGGGCSGVLPDCLSCRVRDCNRVTSRMCFSRTPNFRSAGLKVSASMRVLEKKDGKMKKVGSDLIRFDREENKETIKSERLDLWMRESVVEIVKNLREAPLFVHVHSRRNDDDDGGSVELRTEKAVEEENWKAVKAEWDRGDAPVPEGLIFVEELDENADEFDDHDRDRANGNGNGGGDWGHDGLDGDVTQAWGVVVQGRGASCGPVCYLLKTSRVGSGLGMCSTHFCLTKVSNFRESVKNQFMNCWLLQNQ